MGGPAATSVVANHTDREVEVLAVLPTEIVKAEVIERLGSQLRRAVDKSGGTRFVLDLSRVTFMTSGAIGMLMNIRVHLQERGYSFVMAGVSGDVGRVFEQTRLKEVMPVYETVAEAVASLVA